MGKTFNGRSKFYCLSLSAESTYMTMDMETGLTHTSTTTVTEKDLAANIGSGDLNVWGTPAMTALMENAAMLAVASRLPEGSTTVGGYISTSHIRPTGPGKTVSATAVLLKEEGRKLTFSVSAQDEAGLIGEGEHIRFIIDRKKFMDRL